MSNVVVYVFLLDSLAGFKNALNETVIKNTPSLYSNYTPVLRQCDASISNQILNAVTKELDTEIMPRIKYGEKFASSTNDELNDVSQDIYYNTLLASSLPVDEGDEFFARAEDLFENDSNQKYRRTFSFENEENIIEVKNNKNKTNFTGKDERLKGITKNYTQDDHKENVNDYIVEYKHKLNTTNYIQENENKLNTNNFTKENDHNELPHDIYEVNINRVNTSDIVEDSRNATTMEVDFPRDAPFLVAIFETLGNITAQTCAGTLIAPNWVLTGANCVNILSNLYANDTNMTDSETLYTIVAGAVDPLSDGSAHNVTAVLQHQGFSKNSTKNRKSVHVEIGPFLAMMKIEPEFEGVELPVMQEKVKKGNVMIYGWILTKNDSGLDTLNLVIMNALILSTAECQAMYSFNNNDVICLFNNDKETNITQLSSGGPVLILHGGEVKLLAVVQTDEHVFIAYPLYVYYNWIKTILNSNL